MTQSDRLRASFPVSLGATLLMIAVPLFVIWISTQVLYFSLSPIAAFVLSLLLSLLCAVVLARIWERRSKRAEISFSELMIWSWYRLQKAERQIEKGLRETELARSRDEQLQVLHQLTAALESKDPYTRGHSRRVERHSFKTGVAMGLAIEDVEVLRMSASLHDVGKIRVPNRVLHKPGVLSPEERAMIEEHPRLGAEMVASIKDDRIVDAVRHHHERWDGHGYPAGIAGTAIPLFSRVIAVADSYDAIRSTRAYRAGASRDQAVAVLTRESGHQFDPQVVDAFLTTLPARSPVVAAITSLATGPGALWHWLRQGVQRFGSVAIAPIIGAAGTAAVIAATTLLGPQPTPSFPAAASGGTNTELSASPEASASPAAEQRLSAAEKRERREERRAIRLADKKKAAAAEEKRNTDGKKGGGKGDNTSGSGTAGSPTGSTQEPSTSNEDDTSGSNDPATGDTSGGDGTTTPVEGDPNDEGKDCKGKDSKGSDLHCD